MLKIILAILIFSIIVIFHEFGHFIVAKKCGIQVNEFCLGLGPTLISKQIGETKYCLNLLPFGGACMMEGEDEASDSDRAFNNKPVWQRALVVAAGPFNNFILALLFAIIMVASIGVMEPVIGQVEDNSPMDQAGIQAGDEIISLNNYRIRFYQEVSVYNFLNSGKKVHLTYERDGKRYAVDVKPELDEESGRYLLGFTATGKRVRGGFFGVIGYSFAEMKYYIYSTFKSLWLLITGQISVKQMSGPVGIVKTIGDTYDASKSSGSLYIFVNLLNLSALLSANLMVMNLLPLPALDGGRLVFFLIEAIRGKKINDKVEGTIHFIGFVLLMALMVLVLFNDIHKIFF